MRLDLAVILAGDLHGAFLGSHSDLGREHVAFNNLQLHLRHPAYGEGQNPAVAKGPTVREPEQVASQAAALEQAYESR